MIGQAVLSAASSSGPATVVKVDPRVGAQIGLPEATRDRLAHATSSVAGSGMMAGVACMQGKRVHMEDAHVLAPSIPSLPGCGFFAVHDGHGGTFSAAFAAEQLLPSVVSQPDLPASLGDGSRLSDIMKRAFIQTDARLRKEVEGTEHAVRSSGCTACVALVTPTLIVCSNAGDSRCIVVQGAATRQLNVEHKPTDAGEAERIINAGSMISRKGRINGCLNVSRALGDHDFKDAAGLPLPAQAVSPEPDVVVIERTGREPFLVIGCDGVWDALSNDEAATIVHKALATGGASDVAAVAEQLVDEAYARGSTDNITAVVVVFVAEGSGGGDAAGGAATRSGTAEASGSTATGGSAAATTAV